MSVEEPPPVSSIPSTSTWNSMTSSSSTSSSSSTPRRNSWTLSLDFGNLSLELREGRYQKHPSPGPQSPRVTNTNSPISMPAIVKNRDFYRCPPHKSGRFRPYEVPFEHRHRKRTKTTTKNAAKNGFDLETLLKIKLKGDVEPLRMCIFDREKVKSTSTTSSSSKPCSVQAVRPPSRGGGEPSEEIDELTEYFTHFVRVELKMSALAESMYV